MSLRRELGDLAASYIDIRDTSQDTTYLINEISKRLDEIALLFEILNRPPSQEEVNNGRK